MVKSKFKGKGIFRIKEKHYEEDIINTNLVVEKWTDDYILSDEVVDKFTPEEKKKALEIGLTTEEFQRSLKRFGENKLVEKKKENVFLIFLKQLKDVMIILLFIAMIASFVVAIFSGQHNGWDFSDSHLIVSFVEPFIILFIIVLYTILGGIQELKSKQAVAALKKMTVNYVKVIRNGVNIKIPSNEVVPGDSMIVEAGDSICADGILLDSFSLTCVEASLTGESKQVKKDHTKRVSSKAPLGDQLNKIFSGCVVTNGRGICIVNATGTRTQIGRIATLIDEQKTFLTPLQMKLNRLGKVFGFVGLFLFIVVFLIQIFILGIDLINETWQASLTTSISLAVAAIPEGLGAFTTIILSLGIRKMAKYNALIKKVSSVETLGSTSVICTDKTGTLTLNKMVVRNLWAFGDKQSEDVKETINAKNKKILEYAILCSDSYIEEYEGKLNEIGDPTELAIINLGIKKNILKKDMEIKYPRVFSIPFDSDRKLMSSVNIINDKKISIVKGAVDILITRCPNMDDKKIKEVMSEWTSKGYRVLGVAYKEVSTEKYNEKILEHNLKFLGMIAMYDPPRPETHKSIKECIAAGIKTVMITGDHIETATQIAKEIGIFTEGDKAITGQELALMNDVVLEKNIEKYSVYARVNPEDKLRIVKAWQNNDQVVAMTGDGVNDAPALKAADIGCAMGITGTDVSKEAADMILMDDNFKTIVDAISNGRKVYQTIKRVIQNILLSSIAEIMVMFIGILVFRYTYSDVLNENNGLSNVDLHIFAASQLLWINIMTDGFPAIALGIQGTTDNLMHRRPYSKYESIFAKRMGINLLWQGILFGTLALCAFVIGIEYSENHWFGNNLKEELLKDGFNSFYAGSAASFLTMSVGVSIHALSMMSQKSIFRCAVKEYWIVWLAVIGSIMLAFLVAFVPDLALVFSMPYTLLQHYFLIVVGIAFAFIPLIIMELYKLIYYILEKEITKTATITKFQMVQRPKHRPSHLDK